MRVIGIDLSGPSNHKDTVLTVFEEKEHELQCIKLASNVSDREILEEVASLGRFGEVVIGIDAPLSYEDGGGDRVGDRELRKFIVSFGMKSGSIMPPTLNKMVYLTLRGIKLSREIEHLNVTYPVSLVEVHPGAVIGSRLAKHDLAYALTYKQERSARSFLRTWFTEQRLTHIPFEVEKDSHSIDACAVALGAWYWKHPSHQPKWVFRAQPPLHPYDYCC